MQKFSLLEMNQMTSFSSEYELLDPLIDFLRGSKRLSDDSDCIAEFYWGGRRIDFVTLTSSGRSTAYELKLSDNFRAVEQAAYNKFAFDRSYVVTATYPSEGVSEFASACGVGIIHISPRKVTICRNSCLKLPESLMRKKVSSSIRKNSLEHV